MRRFLVTLTLLLASSVAQGASLTLTQLLEQVMVSHPYLQVLEQQGRQQRFALDNADAAFDPYIGQSADSRLSGYYSGDVATSEFAQPLRDMNGEIYTRYRIADGDFPVYDGQYDTLSAGEASIGVKLSLLKGRETDERRTAVRNARLDIERWETDYLLGVNKLLFSASMTFLNWYESHLKIERLTELRRTLEKQEAALAKKVEQGDEARVTLEAFEANLLEIDLLHAAEEQKLQSSATKLYYYVPAKWVSRLKPELATEGWPFQVNPTLLSDLKNTLSGHPLTDDLSLALEQQRNKQRLAANNLLPKLDVKAELARDMGTGPKSLTQTDTKIGLSFSYPLGNRQAKAKAASAQAKYKELEFKLQDTERKLNQQFETAVAQWQQSTRLSDLNAKAATLADRLQAVEKTRFDAGDTDIFVLNARQIAFIKAQLKLIAARIDERRAQLSLYYAVGGLPATLTGQSR